MSTEIKELAEYKPISEIFKLFSNKKNAVFLDSSLESELGAYSIIGINEYLTITLEDGRLFINQVESNLDFKEFIRGVLLEEWEENRSGLPLAKGGIGYFSYDYGRSLEKIYTRHPKIYHVPECIWNFYDNFIIEDLKGKRIFITANGKLEPPDTSIRRIEEKITSFVTVEEIYHHGTTEIKSGMGKNQYMEAVRRMIEYIVEGDIYIANMTQTFDITSKITPYQFFKKLRKTNPSPFGGYLNYGDFQVISASPERFMMMKAGVVHTRPIKGTRKRGATRAEDEELKREFTNSSKDKSELLMIVDLERNDLNKVCKEHSVVVNELYKVESYATVHHLVSDIEGILKENKTVVDLIEASFPGGSVTGAPKHRAMEIIDELERNARGLYTGSMGYISLDGSFDFNILIRTAVYKDGHYYVGSGGGITCESELEPEYDEVLQKARALFEALSGAQDR